LLENEWVIIDRFSPFVAVTVWNRQTDGQNGYYRYGALA